MVLNKHPIAEAISFVAKPIAKLASYTPANILRRQIAKQTIGRLRDLGRTDISGAEVLQGLRDQGYGIRSQDFYKVWREAKAQTLEVEEPKTSPNVPNMPDTLEGIGEYTKGFPGQRRAYVYEFEMEQWDYVEGKWRPKPFRFSSSKRMKPTTAFEEFYRKFEHEYDPSEVDWNSARYLRTYKR